MKDGTALAIWRPKIGLAQPVRKKPVDTERFDFCFLISEDHLVKYHKHELVNFILEFIQGIQKEITEMKLALIQQSRIAAAHYMNTLANNKQ